MQRVDRRADAAGGGGRGGEDGGEQLEAVLGDGAVERELREQLGEVVGPRRWPPPSAGSATAAARAAAWPPPLAPCSADRRRRCGGCLLGRLLEDLELECLAEHHGDRSIGQATGWRRLPTARHAATATTSASRARVGSARCAPRRPPASRSPRPCPPPGGPRGSRRDGDGDGRGDDGDGQREERHRHERDVGVRPVHEEVAESPLTTAIAAMRAHASADGEPSGSPRRSGSGDHARRPPRSTCPVRYSKAGELRPCRLGGDEVRRPGHQRADGEHVAVEADGAAAVAPEHHHHHAPTMATEPHSRVGPWAPLPEQRPAPRPARAAAGVRR